MRKWTGWILPFVVAAAVALMGAGGFGMVAKGAGKSCDGKRAHGKAAAGSVSGTGSAAAKRLAGKRVLARAEGRGEQTAGEGVVTTLAVSAGPTKTKGRWGHRFECWAGQRPIGMLERLAYERHERDLKEGHKRGLWFDADAADHYEGFFPKYLQFVEGRQFARTPFILSPYQRFVVRSVMGWMRLPKGMTAGQAAEIGRDLPTARARLDARVRAGIVRRFTTVYVEVPRKGGKSPFAAGMGLMLLVYDNEYGAQCVCAATKQKQARIIYGHAKAMVERSAELRRRIKTGQAALSVAALNANFVALSSEAKTEDGANIHFAAIDELHKHPSRELLDIITSACQSRLQPMVFIITTAGDGKPSIWLETHDYCEKILQQVFEDDTYFALICKADKSDDWRKERTWMKAQPNWGISARPEKVRDEAHKAMHSRGYVGTFKRYYLNIPSQVDETWADMEAWRACGERYTLESLMGRRCYLGYDLSATIDLTALVALFEPTDVDPLWRCWPWIWVPGDRIPDRALQDKVPYDQWMAQGFIEPTTGNVVDYNQVKEKIRWARENLAVVEIGFDRRNATQVNNDLMEEGISELVEVPQDRTALNAPMKEFARWYLQGAKGPFRHPMNECLTWAVSNVVTFMDGNGNIRPDRKKSREKIDPFAALLNAMHRAVVQEAGPVESGVMVI